MKSIQATKSNISSTNLVTITLLNFALALEWFEPRDSPTKNDCDEIQLFTVFFLLE